MADLERRVAAAIFLEVYEQAGLVADPEGPTVLSVDGDIDCLALARVAIAAMQEPEQEDRDA